MRRVKEELAATGKRPLEPAKVGDFALEFLEARRSMPSYVDDKNRIERFVLSNAELSKRYIHLTTSAHWSHLFGRNGELIQTHGLSPATHNRVRALISAFYTAAMEARPARHADYNPISEIDNLPEPRRKIQSLEKDEVTAYLDAAWDDNDYMAAGIFASLLINTGMRVGNAMALKWQDIDLDKLTITLCRKLQRQEDGHEDFVDGLKAHDGEDHVIGINHALHEDLVTWKKLSEFTAPTDFVLVQDDGSPFTRSLVSIVNARIRRRAGLSEASPHALRHTYAVQYLEHGGNIHELMKQLNHGSITTTMIYVDARSSRRLERANTFQARRSSKVRRLTRAG